MIGSLVPRKSRVTPLALSLGATLLLAGYALAQDPPDDANGAPQRDTTQQADVSPVSPRNAVEQFLTLTRAGQYDEAARYLALTPAVEARGPELARRLKAVLDRHLWIDLDRVSPRLAGDTLDGLAFDIEQLGTVRAADGVPVPIRLIRTGDPDIPWQFTRQTVARIPSLYASLSDRWILDRLPNVLLRPGPFELLYWQWLALPLLLLIAGLISALLSRVAKAVFRVVVSRTGNEWDDAILNRLLAPLTVALTLLLTLILLPWLALYPPAEATAYRLLRIGFFIVFFWSLWRVVDVVRDVLGYTRWARASATSRTLLPLGARVAKVLVLAMALVAILSLLGYPVASLIAGLGLGGLAFALAAQKTVENLFGAFSIGVDQPFREGDFVKIEDFVGTVEAVGLRSTRFRTLDRTIITIPNGRLAEMRLESFTARDRLRFAAVIGLVYETTASQMREVLQGFERVLRAHPKNWPDAVVVRFREFASTSLDIEIMAWFQTQDWGEFQLIRQDILLQFMEVVEQAGTSIAFPTRTIHFGEESLDALRSAPRSSGGGTDGHSAVGTPTTR